MKLEKKNSEKNGVSDVKYFGERYYELHAIVEGELPRDYRTRGFCKPKLGCFFFSVPTPNSDYSNIFVLADDLC